MEKLFNQVKCPICGKDTLDNFWICPNCQWEYDPNAIADEDYSSANGMTVKEAKEKLN